MSVCHVCRREHADWVSFCTSCGASLSESVPGESEELSHITYLLEQVADWRARGLVPPGSAARILKEYRARRDALAAGTPTREPVGSDSVTPPEAVRSEPPVVMPPAPTATPVERNDRPGMAEFLETHWLKLLAVLAAAFIFAGVRQVLGWDWVSRAAQLAAPLVPVWLSAALLRYGTRARERGEIGSRAYCSVGIVLAVFAVGSVNKQWLGSTMTPAWAYALGFLVSGTVAAWVRSRTGDPVYGHFLIVCPALTLCSASIAVAPFDAIGDVWRPSVALLVVGLPCLWLASVRRGHAGGQPSDQQVSMLMLWSHLLVAAAVVQVSLPVAWYSTDPLIEPTLSPLLAAVIVAIAGASYLAAGLAHGSASLAYASVAIMTLAGVDALSGVRPVGWPQWGAMFAAITVMSAAPLLAGRTGSHVGPGAESALGRCALAGLAGTCLMVLGSHLDEFLFPTAQATSVWMLNGTLALFCVVALGLLSAFVCRPEVLYGAALFTVSATLWARPIAETAQRYVQPWHFGHDLMPAAILLLLAGALLRLDRQRRSGSTTTVWERPLLLSGAVTSGAGLMGAWAYGAEPPGLGLWLALAAHTSVAGACSALLWQDRPAGYAQTCLGITLAGLATMAGLAAWTWHPSAGWWSEGIDQGRSLRLGFVLLLVAASYAAIAEFLDQPRARAGAVGSCLAAVPARFVGLAAAICGWPLLVGTLTFGALRPAAVATACCAAFGGAFGVVLAIGLRRHPLLGVQAAILTTSAWLGGLLIDGGATMAATLAVASAAWVGLVFARVARSCSGGAATPYALGAASLLVMAAYGTVAWLARVPTTWHVAAMAPALAGLYVAGDRHRATYAEVGRVFRLFASVLGAIVAAALPLQIAGGTADGARAAAATLVIYGALYGMAGWHRPAAAWSAASTACVAAAYGCWLASLDLPASAWAAWFAAGLLLTPPVARAASAVQGHASTADGMYGAAAAATVAPFCASLSTVTLEGHGPASVAAMALCGTIWASIYVLRRVDLLMHAGFLAYLAAYSVVLYDRFAISQGVLDLYLIPVGAYLLALGHIADTRTQRDNATALWWLGLLVVLSPTFLAFYASFIAGGTALHAALLLAQCVLAVGWGIAHRIRAFVLCGSAFSLAFSVVLGAAAAKQVWVGLLALGLGMGLLVGVFLLSTRSAEARAWIGRTVQEWKRWR